MHTHLKEFLVLFCFVFPNLQHYFTVLFGHEGQKPLELRCEDEVDGDEWVEAIHQARYATYFIVNKLVII